MKTKTTPIKRLSFLLFALLLIGLNAPALHAQNSAERQKLENKRKKLQKEIAYTNGLLAKTRKSKKITTRRYQAILRQVEARQELIETLREEVDWLDRDMQRDSLVAEALKDDLKQLEEEYGRILRAAFRQKLNDNSWLFVLSAAGINEMLQRWLLLRQYRRFRKRQAALIADTREMLQSRIQKLEERKAEKTKLLEEEQAQSEQLARELSEKDRLLRNLRRDEARLKKELQKKKADQKRLSNAIADIIRKAENKRKKEDRPAASNPTASPAANANPAMDAPSRRFFSLRGRLPWPVKKGVVVEEFGTHPHPTVPGLSITNNGIDIKTDPGAKVLAVHQGVVVGVHFISSSHYFVIIQHGIFYTVYSNLESLHVKKGDKVSKGQALGTIYTNPQTRETELHFEVWRNKKHLNPSVWLKKK
ncbi:MAG TPA: hypothetical protein ENJ88_01815 [Phaeodactylibacter sp.]|nr:hypothetical protein [Phaeodactylibacter sp.]